MTVKTLDQISIFRDEIAQVCERHRIGLAATCGSEGIYGEITLFDLDNPKSTWIKIEEQHLNWADPS